MIGLRPKVSDQGPGKQLTDPETDEQDAYNVLGFINVGDVKIPSDVSQSR